MTERDQGTRGRVAWATRLDGIELQVEHRSGGPSLHILQAGGQGEPSRPWLRFDCFERRPHFHLDPHGRDERVDMGRVGDPVDWTLTHLRADLAGWLAKAGCSGIDVPDPEATERALAEAEAALRNPRPRLDDLDEATLRSRASEKWAYYGDDVLPAWVAEMDFPVAEPIRLVLQRAVDRSDLGYPIDPRKTGLLEAFRDRMADRFDWQVETHRSEIVADVVQALYIALGAYTEPGDGAVVRTPIYPPFLNALEDLDRRLVESRAEPDGARFGFDMDALRAAADARTRILLLCSPHNPTGRVFDRHELSELAEFALERDLVVVSDEIHSDLVYPERTFVPFASLGPEIARRTVTLTSATKSFNIPGLRCAVAHFGSSGLQRAFNASVPRNVRGGLGLLGLYATREAWRHAQPWLDQVLAYLDGNRRFVVRFVEERLPGVRCFGPEATYMAWLDFRACELPTTPGRFLLEEARVALADGQRFGSGFEGFARLNFATSRSILTRVLEAIEDALARRAARA
ncbi:MAG: MalY/PatB family protein [Myxococcota bacterium]